MDLRNLLERNPIIAAAREECGLCAALAGDSGLIFLLFGTICDIAGLVARVHAAGKLAFVHADLVDGLTPREVAAQFLRDCGADGVISTKPALLHAARELGLCAVQRFFVIDSMAKDNCLRALSCCAVDMVEVLPATMPKILRQLAAASPVPLIAGGLISDKEDVILALDAGAAGVSSTDRAVWRL